MLCAYRYQRLGTFKKGSNDAQLKVSVRYLGANFTGTVDDIAKESYWLKDRESDIERIFSAAGYTDTSNQGVSGYYWTSTDDSDTTAWIMYFNSNGANIGANSNKKTYPFSVRLVSDN